MANQKHLDLLRRGKEHWNKWRSENREIEPDLSEADLVMANLVGANLFMANLFMANLSRANLSRADLGKANLLGANLSNANLSRADLVRADLVGANLSRADLSKANLVMANLVGANLFMANLFMANLSRANLSRADLGKANLLGANLSRANLFMANLSRADLVGANLSRADLSNANLSRADLSKADLSYSSLVETNLKKAMLAGCPVYGISAWGLELSEAIQLNLLITPPEEPAITVDNLEVAQFIYLLLHNEKIRDVINTITSKVVLILGRFTPQRKAVLDAIREELRKHNYLPVLFDFDKPASRDIQETITTLAGMARFIIADITSPKSIPQELTAIVPNLPSVPVQPLLKIGSKPWGMFDHIKRYPWVLKLHRYRDLGDLLLSLKKKVIAPAELKAKELVEKK